MTREQALAIELVMTSGAEVMRHSGKVDDRAAAVTMDCVAKLAKHIAEAVDDRREAEDRKREASAAAEEEEDTSNYEDRPRDNGGYEAAVERSCREAGRPSPFTHQR